MSKCPWYVTAHAVDQYAALTKRQAPRGSPEWDDASDELIEYAAATWRAYHADPAREPRIDHHGRYVYRGPRPEQLRLTVVMERRPEGPLPQLIAVTRGSSGGGSKARRKAARTARRAAERGETAPPPDQLAVDAERIMDEVVAGRQKTHRWEDVRREKFSEDEIAEIDREADAEVKRSKH